jgi:hypothetical protein
MTTFRMSLYRDDEEVFSLKGRTHPDGTLESEEMEGTNLWPERRYISEIADELVCMTSGRVLPDTDTLRSRLLQRLDIIQRGLDSIRAGIESADLDEDDELMRLWGEVSTNLRLPSSELMAWLHAMPEEICDETPASIEQAKND